jgi:uncharacterized protein (TIGR00369 family)
MSSQTSAEPEDPIQTNPTQLPGLELLRTAMSKEAGLPFFGDLLGMELELLEYGRVVFALQTRPAFANSMGTTHGGICATLLDSVMGCAVHTTMDAGVGCATLELKINYIRAIPTDGRRLTATGTTIHLGRTIATAEGRVVDEKERLVAHATTTCVIYR